MTLLLSKTRQKIAFTLLVFFIVQMLQPTLVFALTGGPTQPEMRSFQQAGVNEMVDIFSGDFSYNIPLFELPGPNGSYPFNLSYQSGITMEQEATWVGLGWSLNPGAITRQVRGLPDDFKGDKVETEMNIKPSWTVGAGGGFGVEVFGMDFLKGKIGVNFRYNNYKGFGYSVGGDLGFSHSAAPGLGAKLDFSLDPEEGIGLSPNIGLGGRIGGIGISANYHSATGLSKVSLKAGLGKETLNRIAEQSPGLAKHLAIGVGIGLSFSFPGYTPQINFPMKNFSISGTFKLGGGFWGVAPGAYITGSYNDQKLDKDNIAPKKAYGYLNLQDADRESLMDINREKDGIISRESPNLAIPNLTYDIYSVTGQGIGGMYRPIRNDYGTTWDPSVAPSKGTSVGIGLDVNPIGHWGVNAEVTFSTNKSGSWNTPWLFEKEAPDTFYEPWCFKVHGEQTATPVEWHDTEKTGGDKPLRIGIRDKENPKIDTSPLKDNNRPRLARNQVIQTYTVEQLKLKREDASPLFPLFDIEFYEGNSGIISTLDRNNNLPVHHIGAYTALTAEGVRYNYGIPARNIEQKEATFAAIKQSNSTRVKVDRTSGLPSHNHSNTDEFLKITTTPQYAHSYLLTSIVGPDYVDVAQDGITKDDLGYWVKFTYRRVTQDYKWRDPFCQAHFVEGWKSDPKNDKGQYTYGRKEIWYLESAETKSHIAEFKTSRREDGRGVQRELQDTGEQGESLYKLDEIKMYSRVGNITGNITPIQTVEFDYEKDPVHMLCRGIENGPVGKGKLTLRKLKFKYGTSTKGAMNPYVFTYGENPGYGRQSFDRWGNYKLCPAGDPMSNVDFPYVNQDPANKAKLDTEISAWSLKEIRLPNGGSIKVDYEVDDYAYVQHLPAMQMMEMASDPENSKPTELYSKEAKAGNTKICFKLEEPIVVGSTPWSSGDQEKEVKKYLDLRRGQLYFKCLIALRPEATNRYWENISGYIDLDPARGMGLIKEGGSYTKGYFYVQREKEYHPISMRAWQHLRSNQPELTNLDAPGGSPKDKIIAMVSTNIISQIRKMFEGFNKFCYKEGFGKEINLGKSWIRLFSPDKIKYGGGLRVKQLTQTDEWDDEEEGIYGSHYDYTCEQGGKTISSGVAAYEPLAGGEEISLRYAKKYVNSVPLRADNNLFFEYPINESYYPGAQVGYSKVTVRSLVAAVLAGKALNHIETGGKKIIPSGSNVTTGVSGISVHEFYTSREFPVITDETNLELLAYDYDMTIPFLGSRSEHRLAGSQGYSVITNDMHGKPKKMSQYRVDKNGIMEAQPISWVSYNYRMKESLLDGERIYVLDNKMKAGKGALSVPEGSEKATHYLAQETDFFLDSREYKDESWSTGPMANLELLFFFFFVLPLPIVFPNVSDSKNSFHTAVTNKAIFRSGILETTEAYNEGSHMKTNILAWDIRTGAPLLQHINNNYDAPIYSLTTPAYTRYPQMGSAAKNIGLEFTTDLVRSGESGKYIYTGSMKNRMDTLLIPGDEIIATRKYKENEADKVDKEQSYRLICTGKTASQSVIFEPATIDVELPEKAAYKAKIVRSGYRNMTAPAAQVLTMLSDPRKSTTKITITKTVQVPK